MRIPQTVAGLWFNTGGPAASMAALCREMARRGYDVCLLTGEGDIHPDVAALRGTIRVRTEPPGAYAAAHWSRRYNVACAEEARAADVVHDNGVRLYTNWTSAWSSFRAGRPLVRSPRGMLSPWSLGRSRLKKRILWHAIERRNFQRAATVHMTSALEGEDVRSVRLTHRIAEIPNGIDTEGAFGPAALEAARAPEERRSDYKKKFVFLSRIHPKKGLDLACAAWEALPRHAPAELIIAGGGPVSETQRLRAWVGSQQEPPVSHMGPVQGEERLRLLVSAWALVLPSRSENFGMAMAEAMARRVPALTTTATPWKGVESLQCDRIIDARVEPLLAALRGPLDLEAQRRRMGERARSLIEAEHSLRGVGQRFEGLHEDAIRGGTIP